MWQYYLLLIAADILLAVSFIGNKLYQRNIGDTVPSGLIFNLAVGIISGFVYLGMNGFRFEITPYSALIGAVVTILISIYCVLGLVMMARGKMALYSLFLMSGGMLVPYVYGLLFLEETISVPRVIGILLIAAAMVLINFDGRKPDKLTVCLGVLIFFLNGFVSVFSKLHQIETMRETVSAAAFACMTGFFKVPIALIMIALYLLFFRKKNAEKTEKPGKMQLIIGAVGLIIYAAAGAVSYVFQLNGAANLPATVIYPFVSGGSIVFTSLAGCLCFKEKVTGKLIVSLLLCLAGTCMFL